MNRYQMAKLVSWAGALESRKRLQKVVFMLKAAGCPLDADFYLHHYGPYSEEVARLTDEMVRQDLLDECSEPCGQGMKYTYSLPKEVLQQLQQLETTEQGQKWAKELSPYEEKAKKLLKSEIWKLEFASTILFFHQQGFDWDESVAKAIRFKETDAVRNALPLAQEVVS